MHVVNHNTNDTIRIIIINGYQSKEGERVGKFNRMQKFVGQQTNNNGWFRAKIQLSFFGPFPYPALFSEESKGDTAVYLYSYITSLFFFFSSPKKQKKRNTQKEKKT